MVKYVVIYYFIKYEKDITMNLAQKLVNAWENDSQDFVDIIDEIYKQADSDEIFLDAIGLMPDTDFIEVLYDDATSSFPIVVTNSSPEEVTVDCEIFAIPLLGKISDIDKLAGTNHIDLLRTHNIIEKNACIVLHNKPFSTNNFFNLSLTTLNTLVNRFDESLNLKTQKARLKDFNNACEDLHTESIGEDISVAILLGCRAKREDVDDVLGYDIENIEMYSQIVQSRENYIDAFNTMCKEHNISLITSGCYLFGEATHSASSLEFDYLRDSLFVSSGLKSLREQKVDEIHACLNNNKIHMVFIKNGIRIGPIHYTLPPYGIDEEFMENLLESTHKYIEHKSLDTLSALWKPTSLELN